MTKKKIRTNAELLEFFSWQTLILYVIKEQKLIATWHSLTPHPARPGAGELTPGFCLEQDVLISVELVSTQEAAALS